MDEEYQRQKDYIEKHHEKNVEMGKEMGATAEPMPATDPVYGWPLWPHVDRLPPGVRQAEYTCGNEECPYLAEHGEAWHGQPWFALRKENKKVTDTDEGSSTRRQYYVARCPHCNDYGLPE